MKIILFILFFISVRNNFSQNLASVSHDRIIELTKNPSPEEITGKKPTTDTVLLKKMDNILKEVEILKKSIIQQVIDSVSKLPNLVNANMQQQITDLNAQILDLNTKLNAANQSAQKATADYTQLKTDSEKAYEKLKEEKVEIDKKLSLQNSSKTAEWDLYISNYLKTEKYLSDKDAETMKKQVPKYSTEIDSFLVNAKILGELETFLYSGTGNFDVIYKKFKRPIDKSKFENQRKHQESLKISCTMFIIFCNEFQEVYKGIIGTSPKMRNEEFSNWNLVSYAELFPYLKKAIEQNKIKETPLGISTTAP
jgi:hypothetical protein